MVERAVQRPFRARAVVAADVDDERVVEFAHVFDRLNDAADFMVGIGRVGGENFRLRARKSSSRRATACPISSQEAPSGHGVSLRTRRDHAQPLLVGEDLLAQLVPAHVELALELVDPFLGRLVRRVAAAGHVIDEERLIGSGGVELAACA